MTEVITDIHWLTDFLKFLFISILYIKNYFQFKNSCIMEHIKYFFLTMSIIENANKFYNFFVKAENVFVTLFLKGDSYWCIFYFYNVIVFREKLFTFALPSLFSAIRIQWMAMIQWEVSWPSVALRTTQFQASIWFLILVTIAQETLLLNIHCSPDFPLLLSDYLHISSFTWISSEDSWQKFLGDTNCIS